MSRFCVLWALLLAVLLAPHSLCAQKSSRRPTKPASHGGYGFQRQQSGVTPVFQPRVPVLSSAPPVIMRPRIAAPLVSPPVYRPREIVAPAEVKQRPIQPAGYSIGDAEPLAIIQADAVEFDPTIDDIGLDPKNGEVTVLHTSTFENAQRFVLRFTYKFRLMKLRLIRNVKFESYHEPIAPFRRLTYGYHTTNWRRFPEQYNSYPEQNYELPSGEFSPGTMPREPELAPPAGTPVLPPPASVPAVSEP